MRFLLAKVMLVLLLVSHCGAKAQDTLWTEASLRARLQDLTEARLAIMPLVAAAKWKEKKPVTDTVREKQLLDGYRKQAVALGLDADSVVSFFATQISKATALQQKKISEWTKQGCHSCEGPSLAALRGNLDSLGAAMMQSLYLASPYLGMGDRHDFLQIKASGFVRLGVTGDYAPFAKEKSGNLVGADIAMGKALAASLGVRPVFVKTSWAGLMADLKSNCFDLALGGVSVTAERAALAAFSIPYHEGGKTLLSRCSDTSLFRSVADVNRPGVRLIVNRGGTNESIARSVFTKATLIVHPDNIGVFDEIVAGRADVMVTDDVEADLKSMQNRLLCRSMKGSINNSAKAIWVNGDEVLKQAVNLWLQDQLSSGMTVKWLQEAMSSFK